MKKYLISQSATLIFMMVIIMVMPIYRDYTCIAAGSFIFGVLYFGLILTDRKIVVPEKYEDGYLTEISIQCVLMFASYTFGYWIWTPLMMGVGIHFMWAVILIVKWVTITIENK